MIESKLYEIIDPFYIFLLFSFDVLMTSTLDNLPIKTQSIEYRKEDISGQS
jgi:hypothetical protein